MRHNDVVKEVSESGEVKYYRDGEEIVTYSESLDLFLKIKMDRLGEFIELLVDRELKRGFDDEIPANEAVYIGRDLIIGIDKQIEEIMDYISEVLGTIEIVRSQFYQPTVILKDIIIDVVVG